MEVLFGLLLALLGSGAILLLGRKALARVKEEIIKSENKYDDLLLKFEDHADKALQDLLKKAEDKIKEKMEEGKKKDDE